MARWRRTYREVDGQRVEGTWRPVFIRNGDAYHLADLLIYADGVIDCWELTDLAGLRERIRTGWVATNIDEGSRGSAHHLGTWRFTDPQSWIEPDMLLGEIADEVDKLAGRPDSTDRCLQAAEEFVADPTEDNRIRLRDKYFAIPEHLRHYALGDMDAKDWPLRALISDIGKSVHGDNRGTRVTRRVHQDAIDYLRRRNTELASWKAQVPSDGPESPDDETLTVRHASHHRGWPAGPGVHMLQNEFPATIRIGQHDYPTVAHAYWALSTSDSESHDRIAAADRPYDAKKLAEDAPRRRQWSEIRLAVMTTLLRAKFMQHEDAAKVLLSTGDGHIVYVGADSAFWTTRGDRGTNWIGRTLEMVRSELVAEEAGIFS